MRPVVSVVIVEWNTAALLRRCLASLPWSSPALELDVIVVDNASRDDSVAVVRREFPAVRLLRNRTNVGFVKANNQGLRAGRGDFLFMLNSDTEVHPGCLERLVEVLGGDPTIGAVAPRLLNTDGTYQTSASQWPTPWIRILPSLWEHRANQRLETVYAPARAAVEVDWLVGAALLTRRDVLDRVGPLDERFFMWWDDLDWSQKLRRAGYRRVLVPEVCVTHHGRQSGRRLDTWFLIQQIFDSEYLYFRLNYGLPAVWAVYAMRLAKAVFRQALHLPEQEQARLRRDYHLRRVRPILLEPLSGDRGRW